MLEVIGADVIPEHFTRELFAGHERCAGKADERGIRQGVPHVERQHIVLTAMRFIRHHDHIRTVRKHWVLFAALDVKLLDEGKDITMVFSQELLQVFAARRADLVFRFRHGARAGKVLVDLVVQVGPVGDDHERPVANLLAQDLLREQDHRIRLTAALCMPEDTQLTLVFFDLANCVERVVHPKELMVSGDQLLQPALRLDEQDKVLGDIQETGRLTDTAQSCLQRDQAFLPFAVDLLPIAEVLPFAGDAPDLGRAAVGQQDHRVVPEDLGNGVFVVSQVIVEGVLETLVAGLQLDEQ